MSSDIYIRKRDFVVCDEVGFCAATKGSMVKELFEFPVEPVAATVAFVGVPGVISAKENSELSKVYSEMTFNAIDGMPVAKRGRKKGFECDRCAGPDMMDEIFREGIKRGSTHYFYGGKDDGVLSALKANLEEKYPGIKIAGMYSPPFRPLTDEEDEAVCKEINELKPTFVWVGIGAPKQEFWMYEHREKLAGTTLLGVGAGFDFFAGTLERAPEWISKAGFEWLYRFAKEPRRLFNRYIMGGFKYVYYSVRCPDRE